MKSLTLCILLLGMTNLASGQSVLPYDMSWAHYPFADAFSKVEKLFITSYEGKKNLKKHIPGSTDAITFDDQGRAIQEEINFFSTAGEVCWEYAADGCPMATYCREGSSRKVVRRQFSCHEGQVDTIWGDQGLLKVLHRDERGRETISVHYQMNKNTGAYDFLDSIQSVYDEQGRYAGFFGRDYKVDIRYLQDSIVIERHNRGVLTSIREIKCGRYGLPVLMQIWVYSERRSRKRSLWQYSIFEYEFRE